MCNAKIIMKSDYNTFTTFLIPNCLSCLNKVACNFKLHIFPKKNFDYNTNTDAVHCYFGQFMLSMTSLIYNIIKYRRL